MLRNKLIKLLGGYCKDEVLTEAVKNLYNTIGADDILKEVSGTWFFQGKPLNPDIMKLLSAEAVQLKSTRLWQILQADVKYNCNKAMFEKSQTIEDLTAGKLWLYTLDAFNTRIEKLANGKGNLK